MNKNILEDFAINSRNQLRETVKNNLSLIGITEDGIKKPSQELNNEVQNFEIGEGIYNTISGNQIEQRNDLIKKITEYEKETNYKAALEKLIEEIAYTWFNRLIAIRFLEVNDYLDHGFRILSSRKGLNEPEILSYVFETGFNFNPKEIEELEEYLDNSDSENLFKTLFIKQCNELNESLPFLFERTNDYSELLFPLDYSKNSVIYNLVNDIPESYFNLNQEGQIEVLGWLYQFYNSELKDQVYKDLKKNKKITKETLPAATQIFTPKWIVKYMVENSLGRLWIDHLKTNNPKLKEKDLVNSFGWNYYICELEQETEVNDILIDKKKNLKDLKLTDITFLDPAMGSGHILLYAFDLLMQLYRSEGYLDREAVKEIITKNLFGLDIDNRAFQIAYFAIMVKALEYDKRFLRESIRPNIYVIPESNDLNLDLLDNLIIEDNKIIQSDLTYLVNLYKDAKFKGSLIRSKKLNEEDIYEFLNNHSNDIGSNIITKEISNLIEQLKEFLKVSNILNNKYSIVVTNPPYFGSRNIPSESKKFLSKNYSYEKNDLFSCFIKRIQELTQENSYFSFVTMQSWMFLSSFEKMRKEFLRNNLIVNMLHMENNVMPLAFGTEASVQKKQKLPSYKGLYKRIKYKDIDKDKPLNFHSSKNNYSIAIKDFYNLPSLSLAYWASDNLISSFNKGVPLGEIANVKQGLATADNNRFLRQWFEVNNKDIKFNAQSSEEASKSQLKWFPYNKGGNYRKWYGNNDYIVNWENDGSEIKNFKDKNGKIRSRPQNTQFYFKPSVSWSTVSSGSAAFRYKPSGNIFDVTGMSIFSDKDYLLLGLANSVVSNELLKILAPTISFQAGDIANIPVIIDEAKKSKIEKLVKDNIDISRQDWDSFETSWDFNKHPLLNGKETVEEAFKLWNEQTENRFKQLKENEEELNRLFIETYNLQNELSPDVEDKYISVSKANRERDIKSLISYAVGCILGRYSLDQDGLIYAGGKFDQSQYKTFIPDNDGIIPILDEAYFEDDIVGLFINWLKVAFSEGKLEENLDFIAHSLKPNSNKSSREVIREYFLKDFIKDHTKVYSKRPIYWLYTSGRNNGFKALIYQHRYDKDTTGKVESEYLRRLEKTLESEIEQLNNVIEGSTDKREITKARKRLEKLKKQLKECQDFDDKLTHLANLQIEIDLDDGVKVNYEKIQTDENGKNLKVLQPI